MKTLTLEPQVAETIDRLMASGRFGSQTAMLLEGLRLVEEREAKLARFDAEILKGIASGAGGRSLPVDEAFDRLDEYIATLGDQKAA